jgi:cobalamin biosynthesis Co2+ chelatase CbiK
MQSYFIVQGQTLEQLILNVNIYLLNNENVKAIGGLYTYSQFNQMYFCQCVAKEYVSEKKEDAVESKENNKGFFAKILNWK